MDSATETQTKSVDVLISPKEKAPELRSFEDIFNVCKDIISELPSKPKGRITGDFLERLEKKGLAIQDTALPGKYF